MRGARVRERRLDDLVRRAAGRNVVAQRQLEADEILEHRGHARAPRVEVERAQVDAVDLDRAGLRVVQAAQQFRERRLAGAVLADDRERRTGRNRQIETVEHRFARRRRIRERDVAEADLARRHVRCADACLARSAPSGSIARCRRNTAPAGAAAPSSAHDNPPNAIMLVVTAALANVTARPRSMRARAQRRARSTRTPRRSRASTISRLHTTGRSRRRVASQRRSNSRRRCAVKRSTVQVDKPEQAQLFGGRRIDREPVRVVGVTLRLTYLVGVAIAPHGAFAQQPLRREPAAARAAAAPTTRTRRAAAPPRRRR